MRSRARSADLRRRGHGARRPRREPAGQGAPRLRPDALRRSERAMAVFSPNALRAGLMAVPGIEPVVAADAEHWRTLFRRDGLPRTAPSWCGTPPRGSPPRRRSAPTSTRGSSRSRGPRSSRLARPPDPARRNGSDCSQRYRTARNRRRCVSRHEHADGHRDGSAREDVVERVRRQVALLEQGVQPRQRPDGAREVRVLRSRCARLEPLLGEADDLVRGDVARVRERAVPEQRGRVADAAAARSTRASWYPKGGRKYGRASTPKVRSRNSWFRVSSSWIAWSLSFVSAGGPTCGCRAAPAGLDERAEQVGVLGPRGPVAVHEERQPRAGGRSGAGVGGDDVADAPSSTVHAIPGYGRAGRSRSRRAGGRG